MPRCMWLSHGMHTEVLRRGVAASTGCSSMLACAKEKPDPGLGGAVHWSMMSGDAIMKFLMPSWHSSELPQPPQPAAYSYSCAAAFQRASSMAQAQLLKLQPIAAHLGRQHDEVRLLAQERQVPMRL